MKKEKQMGEVVPLFGRSNPHEIPYYTEEEKESLVKTLEEMTDESPTLYELVEECLEGIETYQTQKGVVVVVPIDNMDACIEEIIDGSQKLEEYERALKQISERKGELGSKIASNVLRKYE